MTIDGIYDEINRLPNSWQRIRLGEVLNVIRGASPRPKGDPKYFGGKIPWIMISDITREPGKFISQTKDHVTEEGAKKSRYLKPGTLILSNSGTVCVPKIISVAGCIHDGFIAFPELPDTFNQLFLYYYFDYIRPKIINAHRQGITQVNLNTTIVKDIRLIVPPINEQKRIVAEIEKQFSRLDEAVETLQRVKANLKRYKASVLKAAVEGKLTEQWRSEHTDVEPASQLLEHLLKKSNKKAHLLNDSPVAALPRTWCVVKMDQIIDFVTSGSRGWAKYYSESGDLFIRAQNIKNDKLELDDVAFVKLPKNSEGKRTLIHNKDILITITGANVTKTAIVDFKLKQNAYVNQHVALARLVNPGLSDYLCLWIICPSYGRKYLEKAAYGAGKPGLNLSNIKELLVALPPLAEQKQIVQEIKRVFATIDQLEMQINRNFKRADRLRQSILKNAFSGKLIKMENHYDSGQR